MSIHVRLRPLTRRAAAAATALVAIAAVGAARFDATTAKETGAFIVTIGNDTLAAESYVRHDSVLQGTSMLRSDSMVLTRYYTLTLDKAGNLSRYEVAAYAPGSGPGQHPLLQATLTPMGNALHEVYHTDTEHTLHIVTPPNTLPFMFIGFGMLEAVVMRAVHSGQDSTVIPMLFIRDTTHYTTVVKRVGKDSVTINSVFGMARAKVDGQGHILGYAAPGSTTQVIVTRVPSVDVLALAAKFASRPIGQLSPTDTVRAMVGGAKVTLVYSRPSMRGRVVFGTVVPWNVVWRTGANAATAFTTDKDLVIGGTPVPAGAYTLFSLPTATGWKLIVSKKTGEWGTDYDPTADLARIDMKVSPLASPVEKMTIAITPQGTGADLTVSWEKTAASVAVQAK